MYIYPEATHAVQTFQDKGLAVLGLAHPLPSKNMLRIICFNQKVRPIRGERFTAVALAATDRLGGSLTVVAL